MTEENNTFDRQIAVKFNRYLESGEHIVWCGKALAGKVNVREMGTKIYLIFFATIWTAFAVFWTAGVFRAGGGMMGYFGVPFIIIGIFLFAKAFTTGKEKAYFAVTNMRILKADGHSFEMEYLKNISSVQTNENGRKADVTYSIEYQGEQNIIVGNGAICGLDPEEAENVRYIIESESAKAHMYS